MDIPPSELRSIHGICTRPPIGSQVKPRLCLIISIVYTYLWRFAKLTQSRFRLLGESQLVLLLDTLRYRPPTSSVSQNPSCLVAD